MLPTRIGTRPGAGKPLRRAPRRAVDAARQGPQRRARSEPAEEGKTGDRERDGRAQFRLDRFGASAPYMDGDEKSGLTAAAIAPGIIEHLGDKA
jgi:hypothetical protein